jgi:hypothetical protein
MATPKVIFDIDDVPLSEPVRVNIDLLQLDAHNPRLIISASDARSDDAVIRELHEEGELRELLQSISANGYLDYEPLVVTRIRAAARLTVLEGNRRLARIMHHAALFCTSGRCTRAVVRSCWTGVRPLAVQRVSSARSCDGGATAEDGAEIVISAAPRPPAVTAPWRGPTAWPPTG